MWILGWLVFPFSRRLFAVLPDGGLAAGRLLALVLLSLLAFWGASLHLVSLKFAPIWMIGAPLFIAWNWKNRENGRWAKHNWRALAVSDAVFLLSFGLFLWFRLRHPEANDLEKPMDAALIAAAMRAEWLPFENPWFSGHLFTNYYYFGPLMGGLLSRIFSTPVQFSYNLIQPLFCAFFLSILWSLCTALSQSLKRGLAAMLLVGLGGHLEPLRQIWENGKLWPLNWWTTSRVIPDTINEYPAFTLAIGDLHAHFFALSLAVLWFCLCFNLWAPGAKRREATLIVSGLVLGAILMLNTWDAPLYGLLFFACAIATAPREKWAKFGALVPFPIAVVAALPYFSRFEAQVSGAVREFWLPSFVSFFLLWGAWIGLAIWAFGLRNWKTERDEPAKFRLFLILVGFLALVAPFCFYIKGVFGDGPLRHQDTVFKFGLQAWLLGGIGIACEVLVRLRAVLANKIWPIRAATWTTAAFLIVILSLAPLCTLWARTVESAPLDMDGKVRLSLNAARFMSDDGAAGIEWLRKNAEPGATVLEPLDSDNSGNPTGDYDANWGRVSAFSGVPTPVGWPAHIAAWGADGREINQRADLIWRVYGWPSDAIGFAALKTLGVRYIFVTGEAYLNGEPAFVKAARRLDGYGLTIMRGFYGFKQNAPQIVRFDGSTDEKE